jgi:hypothetical protein
LLRAGAGCGQFTVIYGRGTLAAGQQQRAGEDEQSRDRESGAWAGDVGEQPAERGEEGDGRLLAD